MNPQVISAVIVLTLALGFGLLAGNVVLRLFHTYAARRGFEPPPIVRFVVPAVSVMSALIGLWGSYAVELFSVRSTTTEPHAQPGQGGVYPVWFGTNRRPSDPADAAKGYTNERDQVTHFGRVEVVVPKAHRFGETGGSFFAHLKRWDFRDDQLSVDRIIPLQAAQMWEEMQLAMGQARSGGDPACGLLFLHGYNTSFSDAAVRAAQIGFDLKVTGGTAFFSWPSLGMAAGYSADEATIEASEEAITQFVIDFAKQSGAQKLHVVAHSMGNRGLLRALQRIAANAETRGAVRFDQIFLAAPDVDRDLFMNLASLYPQFSKRTTLYESNVDFAVYLSSQFHRSPRAGYFLPYTVVRDVDTISVPNFNVDLLGHSYFAEAEALLHDMYDLIRADAPPRSRQRIEALHHGSDTLWQFRR